MSTGPRSGPGAGPRTGLPEGRYGQAVALAITLLPVLLLWVVVIAPLRSCYSTRSDQLDGDRAILARMQAAADALPHLRTAARRDASALAGPHLLLDGDSDAVAAAALQEKLQSMASTAHVSVASTDTLPPTADGAYRRIGMRLTLNGSWAALIGLLRDIDTATPRLLIDDLQIQAAPTFGPAAPFAMRIQMEHARAAAPPGSNPNAATPPPVEAVVTVFGLRAGAS